MQIQRIWRAKYPCWFNHHCWFKINWLNSQTLDSITQKITSHVELVSVPFLSNMYLSKYTEARLGGTHLQSQHSRLQAEGLLLQSQSGPYERLSQTKNTNKNNNSKPMKISLFFILYNLLPLPILHSPKVYWVNVNDQVYFNANILLFSISVVHPPKQASINTSQTTAADS